jgi:hypothetical protein
VGFDDSAINHGIFEVGVCGQDFEHMMESIRFDPPAEPLENAVPPAKFTRQFTPLRPGPNDPQDSLQK